MRRGDPDRWLSSRLIGDAGARADVVALYAYDLELTRATRVTSNALMAEIRLTWWREVLEEIFSGARLRAHPVAAALAAATARRGLDRAPLESMIDGRIEALAADPTDAAAATAWADAVAGSATLLAARTLDPDVDPAAILPAGRAWGLELLRRAGRDAPAPDVAAAARGARRLQARAFPAVAHVTLARRGETSEIEKRLRVIGAGLTGRI